MLTEPIGVVAGVYGNYDGLKAALELFESKGVRSICSLGGLVGLGPDSEKCLEAAESFSMSLLGTLDWIISRGWYDGMGSQGRRRIAEYTAGQLCPESVAKLGSMPSYASIPPYFLSSSTVESLPDNRPPRWFCWPYNYSHFPFVSDNMRSYGELEEIPAGTFMAWEEVGDRYIFPFCVAEIHGLGEGRCAIATDKGVSIEMIRFSPSRTLDFLATVPELDPKYLDMIKERAIPPDKDQK